MRELEEDPFVVLNLSREEKTTFKIVTAAYRKLALKLHPDKNNNDETAKEKFSELGNAYSILKLIDEQNTLNPESWNNAMNASPELWAFKLALLRLPNNQRPPTCEHSNQQLNHNTDWKKSYVVDVHEDSIKGTDKRCAAGEFFIRPSSIQGVYTLIIGTENADSGPLRARIASDGMINFSGLPPVHINDFLKEMKYPFNERVKNPTKQFTQATTPPTRPTRPLPPTPTNEASNTSTQAQSQPIDWKQCIVNLPQYTTDLYNPRAFDYMGNIGDCFIRPSSSGEHFTFVRKSLDPDTQQIKITTTNIDNSGWILPYKQPPEHINTIINHPNYQFNHAVKNIGDYYVPIREEHRRGFDHYCDPGKCFVRLSSASDGLTLVYRATPESDVIKVPISADGCSVLEGGVPYEFNEFIDYYGLTMDNEIRNDVSPNATHSRLPTTFHKNFASSANSSPRSEFDPAESSSEDSSQNSPRSAARDPANSSSSSASASSSPSTTPRSDHSPQFDSLPQQPPTTRREDQPPPKPPRSTKHTMQPTPPPTHTGKRALPDDETRPILRRQKGGMLNNFPKPAANDETKGHQNPSPRFGPTNK